jgi:hypothetical protein
MPTSAEQRKEEAAEYGRLMHAYKVVFGDDPKTRSDIQKMVWEDLQKRCYAKQTTVLPGRDGICCPIRMGHAEGSRSVLLYIEACLNFSPERPTN